MQELYSSLMKVLIAFLSLLSLYLWDKGRIRGGGAVC